MFTFFTCSCMCLGLSLQLLPGMTLSSNHKPVSIHPSASENCALWTEGFFFLIGKRNQMTLWHTAFCGFFRDRGETAGFEQHCRWLALDQGSFLAPDGESVLMLELFREVTDKLTSVTSLLMTGCLLVSNFVLH